jgi:hypothetical protein
MMEIVFTIGREEVVCITQIKKKSLYLTECKRCEVVKGGFY